MTRCIYVFFGLIASGKSTLATAFGRRHNLPVFNTDVIRKQLAGLNPTDHRPDHFGQGIYSAAMSVKTYQTMLKRAREQLASGCAGVILDGSYSDRSTRAQVLATAAESGAEVIFIRCVCAEEETRRRLAKRASDPEAVSDGCWPIYIQQKKNFAEPTELPANRLIRLDTEASEADLLDRLEQTLAEKGLCNNLNQ